MGSGDHLEAGPDAAWPFHVRPLADELLSSWMVRFAHAHGYKLERLCRKLYGRGHGLWSTDVDRQAREAVVEILAAASATPLQAASKTTLAEYVSAGLLPGEVDHGGYAPWILPLHLHHRLRRQPGLLYCPLCLAEGTPYYRRTWRLAFITMCTRHAINLLDRCPHCGEPVMIHRADMARRTSAPQEGTLRRCWHCRQDLTHTQAARSTPDLQRVTAGLKQVLQRGFVAWGSNPNLHSIPYLDGVRVLAKEATAQLVQRPARFETLSLEDRRRVMARLAQWLRDWPDAFLRTVGTGKLRLHSQVVNRDRPLPFWIEESVDGARRHQLPQRSMEELQAIAEQLSSSGHKDIAAFRRVHSVHLGRGAYMLLRRTVSNEHHEELLTQLDHDVAGTADERYRMAFLQDKLMFCLFRFTELSMDKVCSLEAAFVPDLPDLDTADIWWNAPSNRVLALKALQHHVRRIRPKWTSIASHRMVFVSPFTQRPMGGTALQSRFLQAVKRAHLTAPIPSMNAYKLL